MTELFEHTFTDEIMLGSGLIRPALEGRVRLDAWSR